MVGWEGGCFYWGNLKGRHGLKDNRRRWEDNIKINLKKEDGSRVPIYLVQNTNT